VVKMRGGAAQHDMRSEITEKGVIRARRYGATRSYQRHPWARGHLRQGG
jgi:hypothetical protein